MLVVLVLLACRPPVDDAPPRDPLTAEVLGEGTRLMTDLGPRMPATPAEGLARDLLVARMAAMGLVGVEAEAFVWDAWQPEATTIRVGDQVWDAEPLSPSRTQELVAPLAIDAIEEGSFAVLSSDDGSRAEQFLRAMGNAEALVRVTDEVDPDGTLLVEVGHTLVGTSFPSVAVDRETGEALRSRAGESATLTIASTVIEGHTSHNVVGRVEGTGSGRVFVTAHYDSWHPSESAFDNALGVGALLALAEKLAQGPAPEKEVVFLATAAEEQGLQGAFAWAAANDGTASNASLVLNLDVLWSAEGTFWIQSTDPHWIAVGLEEAETQGLEAADGGEPGLASDHVPFVGRGVDAVWCTRWYDRHYHTTEDRLEHLDLEEAAAALRVQWRILAEAAGLPE